MSNSIYDFQVTRNNGEKASMGEYKGKVLLVVNTASKCGFTPQYEGLQSVYEKYQEQGFEVLGFPCDQFGHQEPGSDEEIQEFCTLNFNVKFPMFKKIDVNGDNADPLYSYLKTEAPGLLGSKSIKWNFTKFLVGRDGNVIERYGSQTKPEKITGDIEKALAS
ncbi:MAG: glutathione peroxidase [Aestuariibacter sp.]